MLCLDMEYIRKARVRTRMTASSPTSKKDPIRAAYSALCGNGGRAGLASRFLATTHVEGSGVPHRLRRPRNGTGIFGALQRIYLLFIGAVRRLGSGSRRLGRHGRTQQIPRMSRKNQAQELKYGSGETMLGLIKASV